MKILFLFSLFSVFIAATVASTYRGLYNSTEHPGKCVIQGKVLSPGDEANDNTQCGIILCGNNGYVEFLDCYTQTVDDGYELGEVLNPNANYPECCDREVIKTK